jgi:hypothetical protein
LNTSTSLGRPKARFQLLQHEFIPRGEVWTPGVKLSPKSEHTLLCRRTEGQIEDLHPLGPTSPLGAKAHPGVTFFPYG